MNKTRIVSGERIGRTGRLKIGSSATVFDAARQKVLLTRRADNDLWCLPGGGMDPGESIAETCLRELVEETGLHGRIVRLIGLYSNPDYLIEYPDGNRVQIFAANFEVEVTGGALGLSNETTAFGYFSPAEIETMDLMAHHRIRIADAFAWQAEPFVR